MANHNKTLPVMLTFDLEGEFSTRIAASMGEKGIDDPESGRFGPTEGYQKILKLLAKYHIKASFQVVGQAAEAYPEALKEIHAAGHEIAIHGYTHRSYQGMSNEALEQEVILAIQAVENVIGEKPCGHRSPYWQVNDNVFPILEAQGIVWNSDAHTTAEEMGTLAPFKRNGTQVWEIPSSICADDWGNLLINKLTPEQLLKLWQLQAQKVFEQGRHLVMVFHPHVIGRPHHIGILEQFIQYLQSCGYCRFMTPKAFVKTL